MRILSASPLLLLTAACSVQNDTGNDQMTIEYNQQRLEDAAATAAGTAKEVGSGIGNVAASAGSAIKNEVGDVDVDLDVTRNRRDPAATGNEAKAQ